jgi:outer membrane biosynthesis protein TonB
LKTALGIVLLLAGIAAIAVGVVSAPASAQSTRIVPAVVMRSLPGSAAALVAIAEVPAVIPPVAKPKGDDDLEDLKPADAKPADVKAADVKPAEKAPEKVANAKPAEAKPAEPKAAEVKPPPVVQPRPAVVEAKPSAEPKPAPAPVAAKPPAPRPPPSGEGVTPATGGAPAAMGQFNLRASDTADVFVDGKKVGGSPVLGLKVKPGKHKIRFDCYDSTGEARPGVAQTHEVGADGEKDVEWDCVTE